MSSLIKCPNCGLYNKNVDYCTSCNTLLSSKKRRALAFAKDEKNRKKLERADEEDSPSFYKKYKDHPFFLVRVAVKIIHSIWTVFMSIGLFVAWLVSAIAA